MRNVLRCRKLLAMVFLFLALALETSTIRAAQDSDAAINHAKQIMELSQQEKFEEIVAEFNSQMAAAVTLSQMKQSWAAIKAQFGDFKSFLDQKITSSAGGITVVTLGCQFENATFEMKTAFDSSNKIAGMGLRPRQ